MKVIAGSFVDTTNAFLHIGYTSASVRPLREYALPDNVEYWENTTTINVPEALRLKDEPVHTTMRVLPESPNLASLAIPGSFSSQTTVIGYFFVSIVVLYLALRFKRARASYRVLPAIVVILILAGTVFLLFPPHITITQEEGPPPWEGTVLRTYVNPAEATLVLMHGIIGDALASVARPVSSLAQLTDDVGLPSRELTEGETYALQTYGLDGWGHPFRFKSPYSASQLAPRSALFSLLYSGTPNEFKNEVLYMVESAGADGVFDTHDDLNVNIKPSGEHTWDRNRHVFFLSKDSETHVLLFHRWNGNLFMYGNRDWANRFTGNSLYDLMPLNPTQVEQHRFSDYLSPAQIMIGLAQKYSATVTPESSQPLLLLINNGPANGI